MTEFDEPTQKMDLLAIANGAILPALGPEILATFDAQGASLSVSGRIRQFANLEEFLQTPNNFYLYFMNDRYDPDIDGSDFMKEIYFNNPANKRFRLAYPDAFRELHQDIRDYNPYRQKLSDEQAMKLFAGYRLMSLLVDEKDPGVINNGLFNEEILLR